MDMLEYREPKAVQRIRQRLKNHSTQNKKLPTSKKINNFSCIDSFAFPFEKRNKIFQAD